MSLAKDVQDAINFLIKNENLLISKKEPIKIEVNEEDFVVTSEEIKNSVYKYEKSNIIVPKEGEY